MSDKNKNFNNINLDVIKQSTFKIPNLEDLIYRPPTLDIVSMQMSESQRNMEKVIEDIHEAREEKEREKLRRHNELVATLKEAGKNGATIVIGDNANGIQIQQNSNHSYQKFTNAQTFDYNKVSEVLNDIKDYANLPQFADTFKENADNVKAIIEETLKEVENKGDVNLIKKSLLVLKDLTMGAAGSLIATGILGLLTGIGV